MCCGPRDTKKPVEHHRTSWPSQHSEPSPSLFDPHKGICLPACEAHEAESSCIILPSSGEASVGPSALPVIVMAMLRMFLFQFRSSKRFLQIMKETPRSGTLWYMTSAIQRRGAIYSLFTLSLSWSWLPGHTLPEFRVLWGCPHPCACYHPTQPDVTQNENHRVSFLNEGPHVFILHWTSQIIALTWQSQISVNFYILH